METNSVVNSVVSNILHWKMVLYTHRWAEVTVPRPLLSRLLPGPVTTVFERQPHLNPTLNPGVGLVGVRIPDHWFVRRLVGHCAGGPLALTSANISQASSTLSVQVRATHSVYTQK